MGAEAVRWASVPPYGGIPFGDLPTGLGHNTGRARIGSPIVVPDSFALGQLSKPFGVQPSNPWIVTGSEPDSFL